MLPACSTLDIDVTEPDSLLHRTQLAAASLCHVCRFRCGKLAGTVS